MADQERTALKQSLQATELPKIKKDTAVITSERYKTPRSSPLVFHFEPYSFTSPALRLQDSTIKHEVVSGKDVYIIDDFFIESEAEELRNFSTNATFSKDIFANNESKVKGELPDRAMDSKEKWVFFANPPQAIKELYKLMSWLSNEMEADISTLPWEMYDQDICAPAFATNRVVFKSKESSELGKHKDYDTDEGLSFGIPVLYAKEPQQLHPSSFPNGSEGKPWLISLMAYATSPAFSTKHGLGTIFCDDDGKTKMCADSKNMRFVIFEGDIIHSIESAKLPANPDAWRVSYVFKLIVNPKRKDQSMKKRMQEILQSFQK
ncbi:MAG: hypothetical protein JSR46_06435 [Verrucomicrobia bacterium]|nr:hypothetical protein [Verrucomicrobiota bacterium]